MVSGSLRLRAAGGGKVLVVAVHLLLTLAGAVAALSLEARHAVAAELIMFEEQGCPWCRLWDREVGGAYPRSDEGRLAPLRRIHISEARRSGLGLSAPVTVTPTFVLVDRGVEVGRITGYPGADFFWGMLDGLLARLPKPSGDGLRDAMREADGTRSLAAVNAAAIPDG